MKKFFIGFLAVVIAAIAFTGFSTPKNEVKGPNAQLAYWYTVSSSNTIQANYAYDMSEAEIKAEGAPCPDNGSVVCLVGSNSELSLGSGINPSNFASDEKIAHN